MAIDPITGIDSNIGSENNIQNKQSIADFLNNVNRFMSNLRSKNLAPGAEPLSANFATAAFNPSNKEEGEDWRGKTGSRSSSSSTSSSTTTTNS